MGVGTHGFEHWGLTCINLCSSRVKNTTCSSCLAVLWLTISCLLKGITPQLSSFFCRLITSGHDSKWKSNLWNWPLQVRRHVRLDPARKKPLSFVFPLLSPLGLCSPSSERIHNCKLGKSQCPPLLQSVLAVDVWCLQLWVCRYLGSLRTAPSPSCGSGWSVSNDWFLLDLFILQ